MKKAFKKLMREQAQEMLDRFSGLKDETVPGGGWLRLMRTALGLTSAQLAHKLGMSQANIMRIEKSEADGTITLKTLSRVAEAMNCKVVYGLIPEKSIDDLLKEKALGIAKKRVERINHTMRLEGQGLSEQELKREEDALVQELLEGNLKELWRDDDY
jgi:predicted DNA-binding mobile mystery protein A